MKPLRQSLIDYELSLLKAIANSRAITLNTTSKKEAIDQLVPEILSPVATTIILDHLSPEEVNALKLLLAHNGQIEAGRFTRQFGAIRPMGSARLERERPWQTPANPAEGLWYRGFIYKAFQVTNQEIVYIPSDLMSLINLDVPETSTRSPEISLASDPAVTIHGHNRLRENFFNVLVYLQTHPVRPKEALTLLDKDKQRLKECLLPPLLPAITPAAELEFLLHLGQRTNLLSLAHSRLRPNRDPVRQWLQATRTQQMYQFLNGWRADPSWNDLWHVPGLVPQPTGWENSPLRARSKILGILENVDVDTWLSIDSYVTLIKQTDPDFQRPNGDYKSWYLQDAQGNSLMGFEHWDRVEGALIRYIITHILLLLEVVELGLPDETLAPTSFKITPAGAAFLAGRPAPQESLKRSPYLRVNDRYQVWIPAQASLYDRFQLARFAELELRETHRTIYKITRASVVRALNNGVTPDQMTAFLTRVTNNQIPLKVVETLRTWGSRFDTVKVEQATLLQVQDGRLIAELIQHPDLGPLLGQVLGPTTILVPSKNAPAVRRILIELGYLE